MNTSWQQRHLESAHGKQREFADRLEASEAISAASSLKELHTLRLAAAKHELIDAWQAVYTRMK